MLSPRFVPGKAALALAVCVGLSSPALTRAAPTNDQHPAFGSVQKRTGGGESAAPDHVRPCPNEGDGLDDLQVKQAGEALLDHLTQTAQALLFTMATSPWTVREIRDNGNTPVPDTLLPLVVQPPPVPTDVLDNGNPGSPGGTPVPQSESPEPGTLIGGLLGAGAVAYRYLRRRRGTATPEGGASHLGVSEGDLVVA